jgi:hypothetical protein
MNPKPVLVNDENYTMWLDNSIVVILLPTPWIRVLLVKVVVTQLFDEIPRLSWYQKVHY